MDKRCKYNLKKNNKSHEGDQQNCAYRIWFIKCSLILKCAVK